MRFQDCQQFLICGRVGHGIIIYGCKSTTIFCVFARLVLELLIPKHSDL